MDDDPIILGVTELAKNITERGGPNNLGHRRLSADGSYGSKLLFANIISSLKQQKQIDHYLTPPPLPSLASMGKVKKTKVGWVPVLRQGCGCI